MRVNQETPEKCSAKCNPLGYTPRWRRFIAGVGFTAGVGFICSRLRWRRVLLRGACAAVQGDDAAGHAGGAHIGKTGAA
jgi:hypothetical protein